MRTSTTPQTVPILIHNERTSVHENINVFQHHIYFDLICNLVINKFTATAPVHTDYTNTCIRWNMLAYDYTKSARACAANAKRISLVLALLRVYTR